MKKLFNRDYLLLWLGLSVSRMGDGAGFLAVMWWVQVETGSAVALGLVAMAEALPSILLSPFAGVAADRFSKKQIIVLMDVIRGGIYLALAYTAVSGTLTIPLLVALRMVSAVAAQFFWPAVTTAVPRLVDRSLLERANSMNQITGNLVFMLGTASGGTLIAFFGIPMMLLMNAVSFLLSALSEVFIRLPAEANGDRVTLGTFLSDIKVGFHYVAAQAVILRVLKVVAILNFFFTPIFVLLPKFVDENLAAGPEVYGYLISSMTAGALVAMIIISTTSVVQQNLWIVQYGILGQGLLFLGFVMAPTSYPWIHPGLFFLVGLLNGTTNVYFTTILQRITDPAHMGKVFGLVGTMSGALQPLAQGLAGITASLVPLVWVYGTCALAQTWGGKLFASVPGLMDLVKGSESETTAAD